MVKLVGINHVTLEVGDVDEALDRYGCIGSLEKTAKAKAELRDKGLTSA